MRLTCSRQNGYNLDSGAVDYYDLGCELEECVEQSFQRMEQEGLISDSEVT
jgi:hypothetical protein